MVSGSTEGGKQKEPSRKTALFCKVPLDFVWQLCFMVKYCQDTRKLSMQKSMAAATRRQAIRYRNLKNPLKHDGYRSPHGGYAPCVHITEHDEGCKAQCDGPYPSVRLNLVDIFPCFHDIPVLTGETVFSNFKGRDAYRLHRQGFRRKIPERREDDFPRNPEGLTLPVEKGGALPLPANWNDGVIFSFRSRFSGTRIPCCIPHRR